MIDDALHGKVIIEPTADLKTNYNTYQETTLLLEAELAKLNHPAGHDRRQRGLPHLRGNNEIPEEMKMMKELRAQGLGLYRSEFLFLDRAFRRGKNCQYVAYKKVLEFFKPMPVTIRTLDVGA